MPALFLKQKDTGESVGICLSFSLPMTTASRISGIAPLGVFFDAVDEDTLAWSSGVVQPSATAEEIVPTSQPVNITGATIESVTGNTATGSGTLSLIYTAIPAKWEFTWAAPGDVAGSLVAFTTDVRHVVKSANGTGIVVLVDFSELPAGNASDTIAIGTSYEPDYATFYYEWDFGDPGSGVFENGRRPFYNSWASKNLATGYLATHVYENPGTYTVSLRITDSTGQKHHYTQTITVTAFSGTTYYVSSSEGSDLNDGLSEASPFETFDKGMSKIGTNRRILFKRGDSWTIIEGEVFGSSGPSIIGAYGDGSKPVITCTGEGLAWPPVALNLVGEGDWRIMDIDFVGPEIAYDDMSVAINGPGDNCLIFRCEMNKWDLALNHNRNCYNVVTAECNFQNNRRYGFFASKELLRRVAVLGCRFDNISTLSETSHSVRTYTSKLLISQSTFSNVKIHMLKICGWNTPQAACRYTVISNNFFGPAGISILNVSIGPEDETATRIQYVKDALIEGNMFYPNLAASAGISGHGVQRVCVRNNIFNGGDRAFNMAAPLAGFGTWIHWNIYNNIYYRGDSIWGNFITCTSTNVVIDWKIFNNIVWFPLSNSSGAALLSFTGTELDQLECDNNLWCIPNRATLCTVDGVNYNDLASWQAVGQDANAITDEPELRNVSTGDFRPLSSSSPGVGVGRDTVYVRADCDDVARPTGHNDIGAFEYKF